MLRTWYDERMNSEQANEYLLRYLQANPAARPAPQFRIGPPQPASVTGDVFYVVSLVDEAGRLVETTPPYFIFPDGVVLMPTPPLTPELLEATWLHWKSGTYKR